VDVGDRFRLFSQFEARGSSELYERLTAAAAEDEQILSLLRPLSERQHQPNLLMAAVNYLGGITDSYAGFRTFVLANWDRIRELLETKRTQTNEVGRCATLLPAIASVDGPISLVEVGTSAGLNLLIDRYAYDYGEAGRLGESPLILRCEARGPVPIPSTLPEVVFRKGIDIAPVDVREDGALRWLEACIWPDQSERVERFRAAVAVARQEPPEIVEGDLVEEIEAVLDEAPSDATTVVYHTAVLGYLREERRDEFARIMARRDVVWFSNEGPGVMPAVRWTTKPPPGEICFFLGKNGTEVLAYTHAHGRWVEWV
jgi:hypothetical protein